VESVGNLKGCPSNGGNSLGVIHITSLSTISTFEKNVPSWYCWCLLQPVQGGIFHCYLVS